MTATCVCISNNRVLGYCIIAMTYHCPTSLVTPAFVLFLSRALRRVVTMALKLLYQI